MLVFFWVFFQSSQFTDLAQIACECGFSDWNVSFCYLSSKLPVSKLEQLQCPLTSPQPWIAEFGPKKRSFAHFLFSTMLMEVCHRGKELRPWPTQWKPLAAVFSNINKRAEEQTYRVSALLLRCHPSVRKTWQSDLTLNSNVNAALFFIAKTCVLCWVRLSSRALTRHEISRKCDADAKICMLPELVWSHDSWVVLNRVHLLSRRSYKGYFSGGKMVVTWSLTLDLTVKSGWSPPSTQWLGETWWYSKSGLAVQFIYFCFEIIHQLGFTLP